MSSYLQKLPLPIELNGVVRYYKVLVPGQALSDAPDLQFANTDVCLRPLSGTNLAGTRTATGLTATWVRRSRVATAPLANGFLPLGETVEAYEIDVVNSTGSVVNTLTSNTPTVLYPVNQQKTDFGGAAPSTVMLRVYQLSSTVGRGFPLVSTV